jgi:hypothetical protein
MHGMMKGAMRKKSSTNRKDPGVKDLRARISHFTTEKDFCPERSRRGVIDFV